ncbi:MAG: hypothetical protein IJ452_06005 [Butyricicoccus sp.]|nr:hypothetical protein [Butyricicoccus sp.]MBQ8585817.1 hypothetical protein [Butyricicoccus sp.]
MGIFSKQNKPPIERILDEAMPMVIGLHHAERTEVFDVPLDEAAARAAIARYVETDGVLLDAEALEQKCDLAALMTGAVAAITPTILCIDLAPNGAETRLTVRVFYKEGVLSRKTGILSIDALRRGIVVG